MFTVYEEGKQKIERQYVRDEVRKGSTHNLRINNGQEGDDRWSKSRQKETKRTTCLSKRPVCLSSGPFSRKKATRTKRALPTEREREDEGMGGREERRGREMKNNGGGEEDGGEHKAMMMEL